MYGSISFISILSESGQLGGLGETNSVEVNFNIHVMGTTTCQDSSTTSSGPVLTITSTTVDNDKSQNSVLTNAQQSAMSNMFKQFFK